MGRGKNHLRREQRHLARTLKKSAIDGTLTDLTLASNVSENGVPLWTWADWADLDEKCQRQALALTRVPRAVHVALMPDAHAGVVMPVGGVLATAGTVLPSALGPDIGCAVTAVRTRLLAQDVKPKINVILNQMYRTIPVGLPRRSSDGNEGTFHRRQESKVLDEWLNSGPYVNGSLSARTREFEHASLQVGTLGSGNHFASLEADHDGRVWLLVHSGSRTFGKNIFDRYLRLAQTQCASMRIPHKDLAFLDLDSPTGSDYLREMDFAARFAQESHGHMLGRMREALSDLADYGEDLIVRTVHNVISLEAHFDQDLVVHRKGSVRTFDRRRDESYAVILPGSMKAGSYIGQGRKSDLALDSCAHGAGRVLSRRAAAKANSGRNLVQEMSDLGMPVRAPEGADVNDEADKAYKDIKSVMLRQGDLVQPLYRTTPLGTLKG